MKSSLFHFEPVLSVSRWAEASAQVELAQANSTLTVWDFPLLGSGKQAELCSLWALLHCGHCFLPGVKWWWNALFLLKHTRLPQLISKQSQPAVVLGCKKLDCWIPPYKIK